MTHMRQTATKVAAVLILAAAGVVLSHGTSNASPGGHQVTYTVTAANPLVAHIMFMALEPENTTAYADNPAKYLYAIRPKVNPDAPWSYTTTLADPNEWATVQAYNHFAEKDQPPGQPGVNAGFHCSIAIDGQVVVSRQGDYNVECSTRW
jgi:hypothetical protein